MYKSPISHVNFMNKVLQEEIEQCVIFGRTITFRRVSGSFQCGQVVPRVVGGIDENYRVTTLIFKKYGILPLCLENYALFLLPPIFTKQLYTYTLSVIIYLGETSCNIILNYHGTFIHIFMHG